MTVLAAPVAKQNVRISKIPELREFFRLKKEISVMEDRMVKGVAYESHEVTPSRIARAREGALKAAKDFYEKHGETVDRDMVREERMAIERKVVKGWAAVLIAGIALGGISGLISSAPVLIAACVLVVAGAAGVIGGSAWLESKYAKIGRFINDVKNIADGKIKIA